MKFLKTSWMYLINHGGDRFKGTSDENPNKILNVYFIFFFVLTLGVVLFISIFYSHLISIDYDSYYDYIYYYGFFPTGALFLIPLGFLVKKKFGSIAFYGSSLFAYGLLYLSCLAIFLGKESGLFLYLLSWFPLPFLLFRRRLWWLVALWQVIMSVNLLLVFLFVINFDPLLPVPTNVEVLVSILTVASILFTFATCNYYFWHINTRAEEALIEKDTILQQELDFAQDIQQGILPQDLSPWKNLSFSVTYLPMGKVSGDYFDIFRFKDQLYLLLADISGHGVPAALITMLAKQTFSSLVKEGKSPAELFKEANTDLIRKIKTQDYLTAFMIHVDPDYGMTYANASHNKPLFFKKKDNKFSLIDTPGFMIGAIEDVSDSFENKKAQLSRGDRLFLYTDGILEQKNQKDRQFGMRNLVAAIKSKINDPIEAVHSEVIHQWLSFSKGVEKGDDLTFISVEVK